MATSKDFAILSTRITCILPMGCILIKEKFEDENFMDSEVIMRCTILFP